MSTATKIVFCVSDARSMKEVSPLLQGIARVRWVPDLAALARMFMVHPDLHACLLEMSPTIAQTLEEIRNRAPRARRIVLADSCDLKTIRSLLETKLADELVYRPLEKTSLLQAIGITLQSSRATPALPR